MSKEYVKTVNGFSIYFEMLKEDINIYEELSEENTGVDHSDIFEEVKSGKLKYFCAKVTACKFENESLFVGSDYLGCCIYKDGQDFIQNSGYFDDMVKTAINDVVENSIIDILNSID